MNNANVGKGLAGLTLLDFPVAQTPVFLKGNKEIEGHKAIVRSDTGAVLGLVSDQYKLVTHRQQVEPYLERLGREGWDVNQVRLERNGAKVYIELHNREGAVAVKVGDPVGRRLLLWNSYDGTTSVAAQGGYFVLICLNGATAPRGLVSGTRFGHQGDVLGKIDNSADLITHQLDEVVNLYRGLADTSVSKEIAKAIIQEVCGVKKLDLVTAHWTRTGHGGSTAPTAWNLYNAITHYLTHEFGGQIKAREEKNRDAIDLITNPEKVRELIEQQRKENAARN